MTGGAPRINFCGADQLLLTICLYIYPHASSDEIAAFIVANGGGTYSRPGISKRYKELDLVRKACSHEAYRASLPGKIQKAVWFVTLPPPLGVRGLRLGSIAGYQRNRMLPFQGNIQIWTGAPDMLNPHPVRLHMHRSKS